MCKLLDKPEQPQLLPGRRPIMQIGEISILQQAQNSIQPKTKPKIFVSIFCPELQRLLKPIYDLTRKGRQFVWGKEHQDAFEEIK